MLRQDQCHPPYSPYNNYLVISVIFRVWTSFLIRHFLFSINFEFCFSLSNQFLKHPGQLKPSGSETLQKLIDSKKSNSLREVERIREFCSTYPSTIMRFIVLSLTSKIRFLIVNELHKLWQSEAFHAF